MAKKLHSIEKTKKLTEYDVLEKLIVLGRSKMSEIEIFQHISDDTLFDSLEIPSETFPPSPIDSPYRSKSDVKPINIESLLESISGQEEKRSVHPRHIVSRMHRATASNQKSSSSQNRSPFARIKDFAKAAPSQYFMT